MSVRLKLAEIPEGGARVIEIDGVEVAVFRRGNAVHALGNRCPHTGGPLALGKGDADEAVCPWHGARFDLTTGAVTRGPAQRGLPCFGVEREGDVVVIAHQIVLTSS